MSPSIHKAAPITEEQKRQLLALIKDHEKILTSKASDPHLPDKKARAWMTITSLFNAANPGQEPRRVRQMKRSWEHIKRKAKAEDLAFHKKLQATGVGAPHPPDPPKFSEEVEMARTFMSKDLAKSAQSREFGLIYPVDDQGDAILGLVIEHEEEIIEDSGSPLDSSSFEFRSSLTQPPTFPLPSSSSSQSPLSPSTSQSSLSPATPQTTSTTATLPSFKASASHTHPAPKPPKRRRGEEVEVTLKNISDRGSEIHSIQMRVEEAKLAAETERLKAFQAMSTFFRNADEALISSKDKLASIASSLISILEEGKGAFEAMALSYISPRTEEK